MTRRRSIFDAPDGRSVSGAVATAPPSMPPIRWDYETPRPPGAVLRPGGDETLTPRPRARATRWLPLVSAALGGAALALGFTLLLLATWWLGL